MYRRSAKRAEQPSTVRPHGLFAVLTGAMLAAACGGGGAGSSLGPAASTGPNSTNPAALALSECMRAHGVSNFPDPTSGSGGQGLSVAGTPGGSTVTVAGKAFSGPAFQSAAKACRFGPVAGGSRPALSEAQKQGMLASARCMRRHGVPNFPDPTFGPGGHGVAVTSTPGVDRRSPAFVAANQACAHIGTPIPGGG